MPPTLVVPGLPERNVFHAIFTWKSASVKGFLLDNMMRGNLTPHLPDKDHSLENLVVMPVDSVREWISPTFLNLFDLVLPRDDRSLL